MDNMPCGNPNSRRSPALAHEDKSYRASLRRIRLDLKYESREDLIGTEISIDGRAKIKDNITAALRDKIPNIADMVEGGFLGKYTLLDLTFELNPQPEFCPSAHLRLLQEFGFLAKTREEALETNLLGCDPKNNGALYLIEEGLDEEKLFLRLFLDPVHLKLPKPQKTLSGLSGLVERVCRKLLPARRILDGNAFIDSSFPIEYRVTDACITNARAIWLFKHFYM